MIKTDAPIMQTLFSEAEVEVPAERRQMLVQRGRTLYGKFCGTGGRGICAESFAEYHLWRGEYVVVRDLLEFLIQQTETLRQAQKMQPQDGQNAERLLMTEKLINRLQALLQPEPVQA